MEVITLLFSIDDLNQQNAIAFIFNVAFLFLTAIVISMLRLFFNKKYFLNMHN